MPVNAPIAPRNESEYSQEIVRLESETNIPRETVGLLADRLNSVLRPSHSDPGPDTRPHDIDLVPESSMCKDLRNVSDQMKVSRQVLDDLISRLAI